MDYIQTVFIIIAAYLIGSIPTALVFSRYVSGVDIRNAGDANMGARNVFHVLGPKYGVFVAVIDIIKGASVIIFARVMGLDQIWVIAAGIAVILGHDFPIFAHFKGGQGLATSFGTMLALSFFPSLIGLTTYGLMFLFLKHSPRSAGVAGAVLAAALIISGEWVLLVYFILIMLFIPIKQHMDSTRRKLIASSGSKDRA